MKKSIAITLLSMLELPLMAAEFTTRCCPAQAYRNIGDMSKVESHFALLGNESHSFAYLGKVNSYQANTFLYVGLPTNFYTSATLVVPIAAGRGGALQNADLDIWSMGMMSSITKPGTSDQTDTWLTYDDDSGAYPLEDGSYFYLNGQPPVKLLDDVVCRDVTVAGGSTLTFNIESIMREIGMAFNRGGTMDNFLLLRLNADAPITANATRMTFWPVGYSTDTAAASEGSLQAMHVLFSGPDNIPAPQSRLSAVERESEEYIRSNVSWVQYRDSDGASGFAYPAYCGVKDGKRRNLYFTIDAPAYTLTNAYLNLNALPPFTGTVPSGARVSLSLMGFADAPGVNQDFVVTDDMFAGQTPIVLQEDVLRGGIHAGKQLVTKAVAHRHLIRALNARVKSLSNKWAKNRGGRKAVFRLAVEDAGGTDDWGFSIGSVATPGVEAFFEAIEYREIRFVRFPNWNFEEGDAYWTFSPSDHTENQIAVVEDPLNPQNHCLRFKNVDMPKDIFKCEQWLMDDALVKSLRSLPFQIRCQVYTPAKIQSHGTGFTLYGHIYCITKDANGRDFKLAESRYADHYIPPGSWLLKVYEEPKVFSPDQQMGLKTTIQFQCNDPVDQSKGDVVYIDDVELRHEVFYDYPEEQDTLTVIIR